MSDEQIGGAAGESEAVAFLTWWNEMTEHVRTKKTYEEMEAENARLRAALQEVVDVTLTKGSPIVLFARAHNIAHRALGSPEEARR